MKCSKCHIEIASNQEVCPLCQTPLEGKGKSYFPYVPTIYKKYTMFFKIWLFCSIVVGVISVFLDILIPTTHHFSVYIIAGLACLLILLKICLSKRENIPQVLLWQVLVISVITVLWDYFTVWHGWSVSYVIPILCIVASIDMVILAKVMKDYIDEQFIYFLGIIVIGLIPGIFILTNIVTTKIPSLICIFFNIIAFFLILIFRWDTLIEEVKRRFHV